MTTNKLDAIMASLLENASSDFKACILAGVPIEYSLKKLEDGSCVLTGTTVDKCAVVKHGDQVIVYCRKSE